jgi:molybdopterin converting factor small subunit
MQVRVKLMGMLKPKTPPEGKLDLPAGSTIDDALAHLEIPPNHVMVVSVNGQHQRDRARPLASNDELMVLPPVGGG